MSTYYDDPDFADEYRERDDDALEAAIQDRQRAALGAALGICRAFNPTRTFMCDLDAGHDGDHQGFELPTATLDEEF